VGDGLTNLNTRSQSLAFRIRGHTYHVHSIYPLSGKKVAVSSEDMAAVISFVKGQCKDVAEMLRLELNVQFSEVELMNALGIVFPHSLVLVTA
jgi:hypothetical protein